MTGVHPQAQDRRILIRIAALWLACFPLGVGLVLATAAETPPGRCSALGLVAAGAGLVVFSAGNGPRSRRIADLVVLAGLCALALGVIGAMGSSTGSGPIVVRDGASPTGEWSGSRLPLTETDQMKLITGTAPDWLARTLHSALPYCMAYTLDFYRAMDRDPDFAGLGSLLGEGYRDLAGLESACRPYWRLQPKDAGDQPRPTLIFLHGFGGNFRSYPWVWRSWVQRTGCRVLIPSLGFGRAPARGHGLDPYLEDWRRLEGLDRSPLWLAGLSNGALRAVRAASARPSLYRGVLLISPIARAIEELGMPTWSGTRALDPAPFPRTLVVHGDFDAGLSWPVVRTRVRTLDPSANRFQAELIQGMDHFLIYRTTSRLMDAFHRWVGPTLMD